MRSVVPVGHSPTIRVVQGFSGPIGREVMSIRPPGTVHVMRARAPDGALRTVSSVVLKPLARVIHGPDVDGVGMGEAGGTGVAVGAGAAGGGVGVGTGGAGVAVGAGGW